MGLKMLKILWHLNNMSHKNFLRCIIAIFIVRMFEGWRVVRCGFGGRSQTYLARSIEVFW